MRETRARTPGGFVLVEILIVIAIIALVVVGYYGLTTEREGEEARPSTPKQAIDRGKAAECAANLRNLRAEIELFYAEHGRYPEKFNPSGGLGICPVSGEPYVYDRRTDRKIFCTTPGHEQL
ncbi:MAG: prepilin-type N-terminal cleavage/methylation domain-containing protein [Armatimonadota bacterium]